MKKTERRAINDKLKKYTCMGDENDFIEITEWTNGEGFDVTISCVKGTEKQISLLYDELEAINYLTKSLNFLD